MKQESLLTHEIIAASIEVHRHLGPGLLESVYEECLCRELTDRGVGFERQVPLPIIYKGLVLGCAYRLDLIVAKQVVVELKAVHQIEKIHVAQLLTYLRLVSVHKLQRPSFRRRPESSKSLNPLDPGLRRDDAVSK